MRLAPPTLVLQTVDETRGLAAAIAPLLKSGDVLLLSGHVGAGKTAFARALIRARLAAPNEEVPSPTFTLVQTYPHPQGDLWHADLYRLTHPDEVQELGLEDAFETAICLIEWPDRLGTSPLPGALTVKMAAHGATHHLTMSGDASWAERLKDILARWPKTKLVAGTVS